MSRIGKKPIAIPSGVEVRMDGTTVLVKGPKGALSFTPHAHARVAIENDTITVAMEDVESKLNRALWGTTRTRIANMIVGVTEGFQKSLEVNGVGYKVALSGAGLKLDVGFSHSVDFPLPSAVKAAVDKNVITLTSIDPELLGNVAARLRAIRKPEPYKGKGIKLTTETIRRKAGKAAKSA
jgi:large subunit ribosomal protein L6